MKKLIILLALVLSVSVAFSQKGKVTSALSFKESGKLDKALETIEQTIDPTNEKSEKSIPWARTWEVRGEIYQAIYQTKDEAFKNLAADPLTTAVESYTKALELDEAGKNAKSLKIKFTLLISDLTNQAVNGFNEENFEVALKSFEQVMDIQNLPLMKEDSPDAVDTVIIFNSALAAYNAQDYDKAIKYYKEAAKYDYNGARTYLLIASSYEMQKDTIGCLETLKEGFKKYPEDTGILFKMINIYLETEKTEEAMKNLTLAIEQDPTNASLYFAKGTLHDKVEDTEGAIECYNKSLELNPEDFNSNYNIGAVYYNKGVKQFEIANNITDNDEYEKEKAKADIWFDKALPYMVKCFELNDKDISTLESLKNLYYRKKEMEKYNDIVNRLNNL